MAHRIHQFLDQAVNQGGEKVAVIDFADRSYSWLELAKAADQAKSLLTDAGVKPGDRVVLAFENCIAVPAFFFAVSRLDAIVVLVNARVTAPELERIFDHSEPSTVVFCTQSSKAAAEHADRLGATKHTGVFGSVSMLVRQGGIPEPVEKAAQDQVAVLLYTTGTTGAPKAAMLTHGNLIAASHATARVRQVDETAVSFLALPLSHVFGLVTLLAACSAHATVRLEAKFDVERLYDALNTDVTHLPAVPQMHAHLFHYAQSQSKPKYDKGVLRFVSSGGAPLDPVWKREAERFYGLPLQNGYGLTEGTAGVCATVNQLGDPDISVGHPMDNCLIQIDFKSYGAEPDKGIGEILVGGPQVMKGYFRDPDQTAQVLTQDGFFRTGDLGRIDDSGRLHITGRSKELIIRSGFNVYPIEVEAALTEHPKVIVAGVVGRKVTGNEEVIGFVQVAHKDDVTEEELKSFVHDKLAPYKRPSRVVIATELPAAATGKLLKAKLLEAFSEELVMETS